MGTGSPQIVTNFELHRHPAGDPAFNIELTPQTLTPQTDAFWRYRKLCELVSAHGQSLTADGVKALHAQASWPEIFQFMPVDAAGQDSHVMSPTAGFDVRTLWHCLFDQENGSVDYRFYLGDEMTGDGRLGARRSDSLTFVLEGEPARIS